MLWFVVVGEYGALFDPSLELQYIIKLKFSFRNSNFFVFSFGFGKEKLLFCGYSIEEGSREWNCWICQKKKSQRNRKWSIDSRSVCMILSEYSASRKKKKEEKRIRRKKYWKERWRYSEDRKKKGKRIRCVILKRKKRRRYLDSETEKTMEKKDVCGNKTIWK